MIVSCFAEEKVCLPIINIQMQDTRPGLQIRLIFPPHGWTTEVMQKAMQRIVSEQHADIPQYGHTCLVNAT